MYSIYSSEFILLHSIVEVQEDWIFLAILSIGEAKSSLSVHVLSDKYLHFIEFTHDKFDHFSGTSFEPRNSCLLSIIGKMLNNSLQISLKHGHGIFLRKLHLIKLMRINDVNNCLSWFITGSFIISCNSNEVRSFCDILSLYFKACVLMDQF